MAQAKLHQVQAEYRKRLDYTKPIRCTQIDLMGNHMLKHNASSAWGIGAQFSHPSGITGNLREILVLPNGLALLTIVRAATKDAEEKRQHVIITPPFHASVAAEEPQ